MSSDIDSIYPSFLSYFAGNGYAVSDGDGLIVFVPKRRSFAFLTRERISSLCWGCAARFPKYGMVAVDFPDVKTTYVFHVRLLGMSSLGTTFRNSAMP
jgi:hypothetical protein